MAVRDGRNCVRCGARIATDHASQRCSPCSREPVVGSGFGGALWGAPSLRDALERRDFGALLKAYREVFHPPLTQAELGRRMGLSQAQVSRIETGRTPVRDVAKLTTWSELLGVPNHAAWFVPPQGTAASQPPHREFPAAVARPGGGGTAHRARSGVSSRVVGVDDVAVVRETTRALRRLDDRFGGGHGRVVVSTYLATEVGPLLNESRFDRGVRRELLRAAAELHHLAGWTAYDVGDVDSGRRQLRSALERASDADDDALSAEMLAAMSHHAAFGRRAGDAVDLAVAARRAAARSGVPALIAETLTLEAHGLALLGDARGSLAALHRAEQFFGGATPADTPLWLAYFDRAYLCAKFAHTLRDLRRFEEAERFARTSLRMSDGFDRGRLFNTALLASVLAERREVEEAVEHARAALIMIRRVRSVRAQGYLRDTAERLTPYRSVPAVDAVLRRAAELGVRPRTR